MRRQQSIRQEIKNRLTGETVTVVDVLGPDIIRVRRNDGRMFALTTASCWRELGWNLPTAAEEEV